MLGSEILKLVIDGTLQDKPAVWWDDVENTVCMIDQTKVPFHVEIHRCPTFRETVQAIKNMNIRGAPSIGAAAGYGLTQAIYEFWGKNKFTDYLNEAYNALLAARPTAVDLKKGLDFEFKVRLTKNGKPFWTMAPEELEKELRGK